MEYKQVQQIAKDAMAYARQNITPGMHLRDIRNICEEKMIELGADSFWYWNVGAFVFAGDETAVSVSGRQYVTSDKVIAPDDIITIDLSPQIGDTWGDYARTIIVQDGAVVTLDEITNPQWKQGLQMEEDLHHELLQFARPETTFEELYVHINRISVIPSRGIRMTEFIPKRETTPIWVTSHSLRLSRISARKDPYSATKKKISITLKTVFCANCKSSFITRTDIILHRCKQPGHMDARAVFISVFSTAA